MLAFFYPSLWHPKLMFVLQVQKIFAGFIDVQVNRLAAKDLILFIKLQGFSLQPE